METVRGQAVVAGRLEDDVVVAWEGDRISYVGPARPGDPEAREEGLVLLISIVMVAVAHRSPMPPRSTTSSVPRGNICGVEPRFSAPP